MKQVKITDFRAHLPKYLAQVESGETVTVCSRGRPVARVVPATGTIESAQERLAVLRKQARIGDIVSPLGLPWAASRARP